MYAYSQGLRTELMDTYIHNSGTAKHVTLDRIGRDSRDHPMSVDPDTFGAMRTSELRILHI